MNGKVKGIIRDFKDSLDPICWIAVAHCTIGCRMWVGFQVFLPQTTNLIILVSLKNQSMVFCKIKRC